MTRFAKQALHRCWRRARRGRSDTECSTTFSSKCCGLTFKALNVFRYITVRTAYASLTALLLTLVLGPWVIRRLQEMQIGQFIREEGPKSHQNKAGTPTMGGVLIVIATIVPTLLWADLTSSYVLAYDRRDGGIWRDRIHRRLLKGFGRHNKGLSARGKLGLQILTSLAAGVVLIALTGGVYSTQLVVPFFKRFHPDLVSHTLLGHNYLWPLAFVPFLAFVALVVVGSSNAVNLTDGLDGLAIGCTIIAAGAFTVLTYLTSNARFATLPRDSIHSARGELDRVLRSAWSARRSDFFGTTRIPRMFLWVTSDRLRSGHHRRNRGDHLKQEVLLFFVGGVFVLEALSVILQVASFRLTGKRIFRMAPLHHHFELAGWSESKVIVRFWIAWR